MGAGLNLSPYTSTQMAITGFDSRSPVRFRPEIPADADKQGVHVGGNAIAREASLAELDQFLARYLQSK